MSMIPLGIQPFVAVTLDNCILDVGDFGFGVGLGNDTPPVTAGQVYTNPDATGVFTFSAPNVSVPYPGGLFVDGWAVKTAIKADIPVISMSGLKTHTTGIAFNITAPESLLIDVGGHKVVDADPSWINCISLWAPFTHTTSDGPFDSTCAGILPEQCIQDLREGDSPHGPLCPNSLPPSCEGVLDNTPMMEAKGESSHILRLGSETLTA